MIISSSVTSSFSKTAGAIKTALQLLHKRSPAQDAKSVAGASQPSHVSSKLADAATLPIVVAF
jgi:hypothetical protein